MLSSKPSPVKAALSPEAAPAAEEVPVLSPEAAEEVPALQAARLKASAAASREAVSFFHGWFLLFWGVFWGTGPAAGAGGGHGQPGGHIRTPGCLQAGPVCMGVPP